MTTTYHSKSLLLIIPSVITVQNGELKIDVDFAHNLRAYLAAFTKVHVMCPAAATSRWFPQTVSTDSIAGHERLTFEVLPPAYREDRYYLNRGRMSRLLRKEILRHEYLLISPHSAFDWSTLAAELCIKEGLPFNMEADWSLPEARRQLWRRMPWGLSKMRKLIWGVLHDRKYYKVLKASSLSLLQGGDVFHDLSPYAQRPFNVLNVQVSSSEQISEAALRDKIERVERNQKVRICYAGRVSDMKGPHHWLEVITLLRDWGCMFHATWVGDGEELDDFQSMIELRGLQDYCNFPGKLDREATRQLVGTANIFLFCHLLKESPRCLVESLALGTPIVGFDGKYARGLVSEKGGGVFVEPGSVVSLANAVRQLLDNPARLGELTVRAAASGRDLERDLAIAERIRLMKTHLFRE